MQTPRLASIKFRESYMFKVPNKLLAIGLALLGMTSMAFADSFQGTVWSLTYSGLAQPEPVTDPLHQTYRITLGVDTTGYSGTGSFLDQVAIKVSNSVFAATLVNAPTGAAAWILAPGGINAGGCSGSGSGFECVNSDLTLNAGKGVAINAGNGVGIDYSWVFDITVANGTLFNHEDDASVKARFVNSWGNKVGALVSEEVPLTMVSAVPETETYAMMLAGLGLMGTIARRRKNKNA
jgi:PEP-CTERM motif